MTNKQPGGDLCLQYDSATEMNHIKTRTKRELRSGLAANGRVFRTALHYGK